MGFGESGIGSQQNVGNCNVFSSYATAFEKPGLIQKFDIYQKEEDGGDGNAVSLPQNNQVGTLQEPIGVNNQVKPIVRQGFKPLSYSESPLKED
ncbi:MAG: hypothetical protein EAZ09_01670 [Oscillatoriales cyanobacterium]|nr:MAG: hypothetical protein EAZ18_22985 [Oscillatoriales cyanobacterium]TAH25733.1 MAG: hypothetical protein EAZ09_01670 [Oscillatoriales cyanobacterium]